MKNSAVERIGHFHMHLLTLMLFCAFQTIYHFILAYNSYSNQNDILQIKVFSSSEFGESPTFVSTDFVVIRLSPLLPANEKSLFAPENFTALFRHENLIIVNENGFNDMCLIIITTKF